MDKPVDVVERVALQLVEPLGYSNSLDWERVYIGHIAEDGSLADLCRDLAKAAIAEVVRAMGEPSQAMIEIGGRINAGLDSGRASQPFEDDAREAWRLLGQIERNIPRHWISK